MCCPLRSKKKGFTLPHALVSKEWGAFFKKMMSYIQFRVLWIFKFEIIHLYLECSQHPNKCFSVLRIFILSEK